MILEVEVGMTYKERDLKVANKPSEKMQHVVHIQTFPSSRLLGLDIIIQQCLSLSTPYYRLSLATLTEEKGV